MENKETEFEKVCVNQYPDDPVYQPSVISPCLSSVDEDGVCRIHSDVHIILRERNFAKRIGENVAQSYVDNLVRSRSLPASSESLSDDQCFETISSRRLTDRTDLYQEIKRMDSQRDYIKSEKAKSDKSKGELKKLREEIFGKKDK